MNREETLKLARENGFYRDGENTQKPLWVLADDELERFAALVVEREREALAKFFADHWRDRWTDEQLVQLLEARSKP
jgi:hypothetical protein